MLKILSRNKIKFHRLVLSSLEFLKADFFELENGKVIIIDMTNKPWKKQIGYIDKKQINMVNIIKRHLLHCRCKTPITLKDDSIYCDRCGYKIPFKTLCFKSSFTEKLLKIINISMGEALIENKGEHFILIDLDHARRDKNMRDKYEKW